MCQTLTVVVWQLSSSKKLLVVTSVVITHKVFLRGFHMIDIVFIYIGRYLNLFPIVVINLLILFFNESLNEFFFIYNKFFVRIALS